MSRFVRPVRWLLAGALPVLFLFMSILPAVAQSTPGSPNPPNRVTITKNCVSLIRDVLWTPAGSYPPGWTLECFITITTERPLTGLSLTDIVAGGGRHPDTLTSFGEPTINQYNRQEYGPISIGDIPAGTTTLTPVLVTLPSNLGCYRAMSNEVHLDQV